MFEIIILLQKELHCTLTENSYFLLPVFLVVGPGGRTKKEEMMQQYKV